MTSNFWRHCAISALKISKKHFATFDFFVKMKLVSTVWVSTSLSKSGYSQFQLHWAHIFKHSWRYWGNWRLFTFLRNCKLLAKTRETVKWLQHFLGSLRWRRHHGNYGVWIKRLCEYEKHPLPLTPIRSGPFPCFADIFPYLQKFSIVLSSSKTE